MKVVPPTCRPIFIYTPHLTSIKNKLAKFATMAIRAAMVDLTWFEHATSSLQGTLSPIEIQTHMAAPGAALPPLPANAVGYACRNKVSPKPILFKILYRMNYEMLTFKHVHGRIVYWSDYRAVIHIELSHTCSLAQNIGDEPNTLRYASLSRRASDLLSLFCILIGASSPLRSGD